jgi:hypothetical protein
LVDMVRCPSTACRSFLRDCMGYPAVQQKGADISNVQMSGHY